jgi:hypothetical protein
LAKRNNELGRARNRTACRLHALLAELAPGGIANEINASSAERLLASLKPQSPVEVARHALAFEHLDDLRRLDAQARLRSALASVLFPILGLPARYDSAVRRTIRRVVVPQFERLTRIALVALPDAVLGLDQQTIAHHRHGMDRTAAIARRPG